MAHEVFISYSQRDKAIADAVCHRIEAAKIRCWIAPRDVSGGENWDDVIVSAINEAKLVVVIFSSAANASRHVLNEITIALDSGSILIPFRVEDIRPSGGMRLQLARINWLDALTPPLSAHIDRLVESIMHNLPAREVTQRADFLPEMVVIPRGSFIMGSPRTDKNGSDECAKPRHKVTINRAFWLGKFPVTRQEYAIFAAETGRGGEEWVSPGIPQQNDRHPVVRVSHYDALAYTAWLSKKTGLKYRLPSEAEWEYAARAGTTTSRYWGEDAGKPGNHAHFSITSEEEGTRAVGSFKPNGFGLYDMLGNVEEWTADHWHDDYNGAPSDGSPWLTPDHPQRAVRGGFFGCDGAWITVDRRNSYVANTRPGCVGFRCARDGASASGAGQ
jgi:formylglycine-generating enzyme required for sulfatase activity